MHFRRRHANRIELLHGRLDGLLEARGLSVSGIGHQFHPFDDPAPTHLEHLNDRAGRARLDAKCVPIAQPHARHLLLPVSQHLHRFDGVAGLGRLFEAQVR